MVKRKKPLFRNAASVIAHKWGYLDVTLMLITTKITQYRKSCYEPERPPEVDRFAHDWGSQEYNSKFCATAKLRHFATFGPRETCSVCFLYIETRSVCAETTSEVLK